MKNGNVNNPSKSADGHNKKRSGKKIIAGIAVTLVSLPLLIIAIFVAITYFSFEQIKSDCIVLSEKDYIALSENDYEGLFDDNDVYSTGLSNIKDEIKEMRASELVAGQPYYCLFPVSFYAGEVYNSRDPQGQISFPENSVEILDCNAKIYELRKTAAAFTFRLLTGGSAEVPTDFKINENGVTFGLDTKITFLRMVIAVKFTPLKEQRIDINSSVKFTATVNGTEPEVETQAECQANALCISGVSVKNLKTEYAVYTENFENAAPQETDSLENGTEYYAVISFDVKPTRDTEGDKVAVEIAYDESFSCVLFATDSGDFTLKDGKIIIYYSLPPVAQTTKRIEIVLRVTPHISGVYAHFVTVCGAAESYAGAFSETREITVN